MNTNSSLILFYTNDSSDNYHRNLNDIWNQDYQWLEKTHDYIQWLFPLKDRSEFNYKAPVLTEADILAFQSRADLQHNLITSFNLMLGFYGLECKRNKKGEIKITKNFNFEQRKKNWLHWGNHNHLRITRILKSLCLLGQKKYADSFFQCLTEIYLTQKDEITGLTFSYWEKAVK